MNGQVQTQTAPSGGRPSVRVWRNQLSPTFAPSMDRADFPRSRRSRREAFVHNLAPWRAHGRAGWLDRILVSPMSAACQRAPSRARSRPSTVDGRRLTLAFGPGPRARYPRSSRPAPSYPRFPGRRPKEPDILPAAGCRFRGAQRGRCLPANRVLIVGSDRPASSLWPREIKSLLPPRSRVTIRPTSPDDILAGPPTTRAPPPKRAVDAQLDELAVEARPGSSAQRAGPIAKHRPTLEHVAAHQPEDDKPESRRRKQIWFRAFRCAAASEVPLERPDSLTESRDEVLHPRRTHPPAIVRRERTCFAKSRRPSKNGRPREHGRRRVPGSLCDRRRPTSLSLDHRPRGGAHQRGRRCRQSIRDPARP